MNIRLRSALIRLISSAPGSFVFNIVIKKKIHFLSPVMIRFRNISTFSRLSSESQMSLRRSKSFSENDRNQYMEPWNETRSFQMVKNDWIWQNQHRSDFSSCYSVVCFNQYLYFDFVSFKWSSGTRRVFSSEILQTSFAIIDLIIHFLHTLHIIFLIAWTAFLPFR